MHAPLIITVGGSATDRIRSGYCMRCYQAWRRAGNPDRSAFNVHVDDPVDPGA